MADAAHKHAIKSDDRYAAISKLLGFNYTHLIISSINKVRMIAWTWIEIEEHERVLMLRNWNESHAKWILYSELSYEICMSFILDQGKH